MGNIYDKKYNYNLNVFYNEDEISYYLLGLLMTDGCVKSNHNSITLTSKDKDHLMKIINLIDPTMKIRDKNTCFEIGIYSKELKLWLVSKGCTPQKSLNLQFPTVPEKFLPDFLRGCIDGDGSLGIYKNINRVYLCGSSFPFLETFSKTLIKRKIKNTFYKVKNSKHSSINDKIINRTSDHWRVEITQLNAKKLVEWIYYPGHKLSLDRKKKIAEIIMQFIPKPKGRKPNLEKQKLAHTLRTQGLSLQQIAKQLNTSQSRIHVWLTV